MDAAPHPLGVVVRRLLQREGDEVHARGERAGAAEHPGQLQETCDAARVVVGARIGAGRVVVRANDDTLARLRAEGADHVTVPAGTRDGIGLLRNPTACLGQVLGNVRGGTIEVILPLPRRQPRGCDTYSSAPAKPTTIRETATRRASPSSRHAMPRYYLLLWLGPLESDDGRA